MSEPGAHSPAGTDQIAGAADAPGADGRQRRPRGRDRRPLWVLLGVAGVAVVLAVVLLVTNGRQPPEAAPTLDPEIVTLPVPTPTVAPADLPAGTTFFEALPRTVLQYAVTAAADAPEPLQAGALEAYVLEFDDGGGSGFTLTASQWRTADDVATRLADVVAQQAAEAGVEPSAPPATAEPDPAGDPAGDAGGTGAEDETGAEDDAATTDPVTQPRLEAGPVTADDAEVGRYLLRVREDGTATIWWSNTTALLRLDGPADVLRDVYAAFPL